MASAVDEAASILGISKDTITNTDELKSPEQHQASMFAARQQLQAKQKGDSPIFSSQGSSTGIKKVAAIKPQFKPLSKKSSFVTPFVKKDENMKKSPQKLLSPRRSPNKQMEKLHESVAVVPTEDVERQLPTVSSRYHCPSLKRSRGRQPDESIQSDIDDEHSKSKFTKKSLCSPKRKDVEASPISSPGDSPKLTPRSSPRICSPKLQTGIINTEIATSPNLFHSSSEKAITSHHCNSKENIPPNSHTDLFHSGTKEIDLLSTSSNDIETENDESNYGPESDKNDLNSTKEKSHAPVISTAVMSLPENAQIIKESVVDIPAHSQSSNVSTADLVKSALDVLNADVEIAYKDLIKEMSTNGEVEKGNLSSCHGICLYSTPQEVQFSSNSMHHTQSDNDKEIIPCSENLVCKQRVIGESVIEDLLTPQEETLTIPSSSEGFSVDGATKDKKTKKKNSNTDEADRQKVNDFFSKKFGMAFSTTPKGADRPKPVLKFSKKEDTDSEYSTVQSPGKFKSTFKALDNVKEEDYDENDSEDGDMPEKRSDKNCNKKQSNIHKKTTVKVEKTAETGKRTEKPGKKSAKLESSSRDASVKVEKKTKRKIERSPKRPKKEPVKRRTPASSSSICTSASEASDSDNCTKKTPSLIPKPKSRKNSVSHQYQSKAKDQKTKPEVNRKRKKVYSSSESSESENEFTLNCTNSDNTDSIWVQCEKCNKWRYLRDTLDPNLIPDDWICALNPDKKFNNCNAPEEDWNHLDNGYEFVYSSYSLGSLVWCKMQGYPWWPGMVDNDPLTKSFYYKHSNSTLPDKYHVTFFGIQATRAWIGKKFIKVYNPDDKEDQLKYDERKSSKGIREAIAMANQAFHLELNDRKKIYGFREQYRSVEDEQPSSSKLKGKSLTSKKVIKSKAPPKNVNKSMKKPGYISKLYEKAVMKLSQESQKAHAFDLAFEQPGSGNRGRGRPRKNAAPEKVVKRRKAVKRSQQEEEEPSYIPSASRLNSLHVIENIENEINQVLRDCSPSPTAFFSK